MSCDDFAISISGVSKCFQIYNNPRNRIKQLALPWLQKFAGQKSQQYFNEFWALKDISFNVKKGETVGIIGRNGSGKSTLLQIICGTLTPTAGEVEIHGRIAALLELGSGFNPEFTGRENIYMNAAVLGLSKEEIDIRFDKIVAFADIGEFIEQPIKSYSSGMTVRLAFSIIAHVDADILVIDEALSVGDVFFTQKCMRFLNEFMKTGTVLFVSHDTAAVISLCNKAILLDQERLVKIGLPKDVTEYYLSTLCTPTSNTTTNSNQNSQEIDVKNLSRQPNQVDFGTGDAKILSVTLYKGDYPLNSISGGENVSLKIQCIPYKDISCPIVGFQFKDRLGQVIFGENSSSTLQNNPEDISKNTSFEAEFRFQLPMLPSGDYSVTAAVAEDVNGTHIQHHWIHDALVLKVITSNVSYGLVGVPMQSINISVI